MITQQIRGILLAILFALSISCYEEPITKTDSKSIDNSTKIDSQSNDNSTKIDSKSNDNSTNTFKTLSPPKEPTMADEDIELIALVTMAEAEGESEKGKRLVIDTILNRIDSDYWPDTAYDVIYQPSQFSSMWNGRVDRCYVSEDICQLVREEIDNRLNHDVVFFTADKYGKYGQPMFQVGNHYFSSY